MEELAGITSEKITTGIYYIGNDDSPECVEFYRVLSTLAGKYRVVIHYYDATEDSETRSEKMMDILHDVGITSVPSVIVVRYGTVTHVFEGEAIEHQIRQYFEKEWNKLDNPSMFY